MKKLAVLFVILFFFACKEDKGIERKLPTLEVKNTSIPLKYAKGFTITQHDNYTVLEITKAWPNATKEFKYVVVNKENAAKISFTKGDYDGIIIKPVKKIVVTSTTHLPALELLGVENTLVGFPGTDYISSKVIRQGVDNAQIRELGKNESINTEILLELKPNLVIGFGIDGKNKTFETIKNYNIPVVLNGDWVENSPLAKAEWIKFFGALYDKNNEAETIFNQIESDYLKAKQLAKKVAHKPTVLSGAMHSDIWYLPNGNSTEAQLLKDANVNYLWADNEGIGSLKLNFETVFIKAKTADIWLNPSNYASLKQLKTANENHTMFDAYKQKHIFTFNNTTGATGGVLYYELGMSRPDVVLKDLIKICHPELLKAYTPYFFKPLQ